MSVAVIDSLNLMRASMEEEVVLQSTLAVPAHQALACRIEAYGTPFGCVWLFERFLEFLYSCLSNQTTHSLPSH